MKVSKSSFKITMNPKPIEKTKILAKIDQHTFYVNHTEQQIKQQARQNIIKYNKLNLDYAYINKKINKITKW